MANRHLHPHTHFGSHHDSDAAEADDLRQVDMCPSMPATPPATAAPLHADPESNVDDDRLRVAPTKRRTEIVTQSFRIPRLVTQPHDADGLGLIELHYRLEETSSRQPVTAGRYKIVPEIDLRDYRFEAVFDWVEIQIEAIRPVFTTNIGTNLKTKSGLDGLFVKDDRRRPGQTSRKLIVILQDPTWSRMERLFDALETLRDFAGKDPRRDHEVVGLELALDIYARHARILSDDELIRRRVLMSELVRRFVAPHHFDLKIPLIDDDPDSWPRFVDEEKDELHPEKGKPKRIMTEGSGDVPPALATAPAIWAAAAEAREHRAPPTNGTVYIGLEKSDMFIRLQDKTANRRRSASDFEVLPPGRRRTRVEVCLRKWSDSSPSPLASFGVFKVQDLRHADFTPLAASAFRFELPTIPAPLSFLNCARLWQERRMFRETGVLGLDLLHRAQRLREIEVRKEKGIDDGGRLRPLRKKGRSIRYSDMNDRVKEALAKVSKSFL